MGLKMYVSIAVAIVSLVAMTSAELGTTMYDEWAYHWYENEPFELKCNTSWVEPQANDTVVWTTPSKNTLSSGNDSDYQTMDGSGVKDLRLLIKAVRKDLHGVYKCVVHRAGDPTNTSSTILGLNIHEQRYRTLFDKYRHNLIVAVIATAVFVVPLATSCFVWQFQYRSEEQEAARKYRRQQAAAGHQYEANGGDLPMKSTEKRGFEGQDNPSFNTQL